MFLFSPTYNEEEENRLHDFADEDSPLDSPLDSHDDDDEVDGDEHISTTLKRGTSRSRPDLKVTATAASMDPSGLRRLSNSNLSDRSAAAAVVSERAVSERGGSSDRDSRLSDARWRDSCDTVVRVCGGGGGGQRSGSEVCVAGSRGGTGAVNNHEVSVDCDTG